MLVSKCQLVSVMVIGSSPFLKKYPPFVSEVVGTNSVPSTIKFVYIIDGSVVYGRRDENKKYYDGEGEIIGGRSESIAYLGSGPVKAKVGNYYWSYYSSDTNAGATRVVTYGKKGTVDKAGLFDTNFISFTSWDYVGNYGLIRDETNSFVFVNTNGNTYVSSGYGDSAWTNALFENIYYGGYPEMTDFSCCDSDSYGTFAHQWRQRIESEYVEWTGPSFIGFAKPDFDYK